MGKPEQGSVSKPPPLGKRIYASLLAIVPGAGHLYLRMNLAASVVLVVAVAVMISMYVLLPPYFVFFRIWFLAAIWGSSIVSIWATRGKAQPRAGWLGLVAAVVLYLALGTAASLFNLYGNNRSFEFRTTSMRPTLEVGDKIVVRTGGPYLRGDVVCFRFPESSGEIWLKRLIALPGDRVRYVGDRLQIDGFSRHYQRIGEGESRTSVPAEILWETNAGRRYLIMDSHPDELPWEGVIPEGHFFLLGDNRDYSHDSRSWGPLLEELLIGRAMYKKNDAGMTSLTPEPIDQP